MSGSDSSVRFSSYREDHDEALHLEFRIAARRTGAIHRLVFPLESDSPGMIQALPMQIEVRLFAFETDIPQPIRMVFDHSPSLADVLSNLPIPDRMETIVLVNGRNADFQNALSEGDRVAVFPPMTGG